MINLKEYDVLAKDNSETVPVWDNEDKKQTLISYDDFVSSRDAGDSKYSFGGEVGFFSDEAGNVYASTTEDFNNFLDDPRYKYLDPDILEVSVTPKEELVTGEKIRDLLPKSKFGTALSNIYDGVVTNMTFNAVNYIDKQTRKEAIAEGRLREDAGLIGGLGTVTGELAGIVGSVVGTSAVATPLAGTVVAGAKAANLLKLAQGVRKTQEYIQKGKGVLHTGAVSAAYAAPWAISNAIGEKDVKKGAQTMVLSTLLPMGLHGAAKVPMRAFQVSKYVGGKAQDSLTKSFFGIPERITNVAKVKENLSRAITIDENVIPTHVYEKLVKNIDASDIDLSKGITTDIKKKIIHRLRDKDLSDVLFENYKTFSKQEIGQLPQNKKVAYEMFDKIQREASGELSAARQASEITIKGSEISKALEGVIKRRSAGILEQSDKAALNRLTSLQKQVKAGKANPTVLKEIKKLDQKREKIKEAIRMGRVSIKGEKLTAKGALILEKQKQQFKKASRKINDLKGNINSQKNYTLAELSALKQKLGNISDFAAKGEPDFNKKLFREAYSVVKGMEDNVADEISLQFIQNKYRFSMAKNYMNMIDEATAGSGAVGALTGSSLAERLAIYSTVPLISAGIGGSLGGPIGAGIGIGMAFYLSQGVKSGRFLKPLNGINNYLNKIGNFGKRVAVKGKKSVPVGSMTIANIAQALLGTDEVNDINQLNVGVASSLQKIGENNEFSSRANLENLYAYLNVNTPARKFSTADTYKRLYEAFLKNTQTIDPKDPEKDSKTAEILDNVSVLFSPDMLFDKIADGTLSQKHVENFRFVYPSVYARMKDDIMQLHREQSFVERLGYAKALVLSRFVGEDLTGVGSLGIESTQPPPPQERQSQKPENQFKFDGVSSDLRKELFSSKNPLQGAEQW